MSHFQLPTISNWLPNTNILRKGDLCACVCLRTWLTHSEECQFSVRVQICSWHITWAQLQSPFVIFSGCHQVNLMKLLRLLVATGNRAECAARMSRHSSTLASSAPSSLPLFAQALPSPCPPPQPRPLSARATLQKPARKVGQLHRQCGMKFELLGMLNKFCGQLSATKSQEAKYLLNQLNIYPQPQFPSPDQPTHT